MGKEPGPINWDWSNRFWLALEVLTPDPIPEEVFVLEALYKPKHLVLKGDFRHPSEIGSLDQSDDALVYWMLVRAGLCSRPKCVLKAIRDASAITGGSVLYLEMEPPIGEGNWRYRESDPRIPEGWWR